MVASWSGASPENAEYWFIVRTFEVILFPKYAVYIHHTLAALLAINIFILDYYLETAFVS
jgi:hypothetical protein